MIRQLIYGALVTVTLAAPATAQDPRDLAVKTFKLRNLKPDDAAKLLGPYVTAPGGGVFEAGSIGAITVRETFTNLKLIDSLLTIHDRPRAVLSMRFKLVAALDSSVRDPAINDIDAELRKLFNFRGYELIGEGTMLSEEMTDFMTTVSTKPQSIGKDRYTGKDQMFSETFRIRGWMDGISGTGADRTIRVWVTVQDASNDSELMRTGLTLPLGQTVILGSAKPTMGTRGALILVVQPQIAESQRR
jgi:hypothetical protein